jgi:alkanesulfonate monooxygenase SsuD/methylene tetrahydromethanopterin reductase-like flavin-dependent oxidoreductase (luciferase family)
MKIGICLPYMERELDRDLVMAWCRAVDGGPFSSLSCGERITGYTLEMRNVLAAAAVLTSRVRIVPSLYVLPMHSAVWAAKEIATLDVLSGGRVTLCVGVGGREVDYRAVGAAFSNRHARMDEQIAEMRAIWSGEPPFDGADPVGPTPVQSGGPPILAGAMGPKAIARAAVWADGIYGFTMSGDPAPVAQWYQMADEAWRTADRETSPQRVSGFWYSLADDGDERLKQYVFDYLEVLNPAMARAIAKTMTMSTPDAIRAGLDAIEELGCEEFFLVPATADISEVERVSELLERR